MICIANGKDEDDPEMLEQVMQQQLQEKVEKVEGIFEEMEEDLEEIDLSEFPEIQNHIKFVENHPLPKTCEEYRKRAQVFLKRWFYNQKNLEKSLQYDFETIAWYHTLLPVKLNRALAGFHEPACEGDVSLVDAVGQLEVCRKAVEQSVKALKRLKEKESSYQGVATEMLALLHNIHSRIIKLTESV